jgi:hypothetical protein
MLKFFSQSTVLLGALDKKYQSIWYKFSIEQMIIIYLVKRFPVSNPPHSQKHVI